MQLSHAQVVQFQEIYMRHFSSYLTFEEASEKGVQLIEYMQIASVIED